MGKFSPNIIADNLAALDKYNGQGEAIIYGDTRVTWSRLYQRVCQLAQGLIRLGVKKGDKVAFLFHNTPEFVEVNFAIQVAGGIPAPMNYRLVAPEIEFQVNHCDAQVFLFDQTWNEEVEKAAPNLTAIRHFICKGVTGIESALDYEVFVAGEIAQDPSVETLPHEPAVMIYTGGTTGFPKGVLLSYKAHVDMLASLVANIAVYVPGMNLTQDKLKNLTENVSIPGLSLALPMMQTRLFKSIIKRNGALKLIKGTLTRVMNKPGSLQRRYKDPQGFMFPSMPLFHDAAYAMLMQGIFMGNVRLILVPGLSFDPEKVFQTIQDEKPFFLANVPTGWKKLVKFPGKDKYDTRSVKTCISGAGVCPIEIKKKMFSTFPNAIVADMFGQTEMTPVTTFKIDADASTLKDRSVGNSIVDVKIVDDLGNEVPRGQHGEILYRSSTVMMGYYKDEQKTGEAMAGGWFKSGDLGYIDEDGEVRLLDRKKECINTGGEKVFPVEVEGIIGAHPAVENVCVIGVEDEEWGSRVHAVVQLHGGESVDEQEIIEFCRGKIAGYKIPKSVVFVEEFPLSPVGKILRAKVREMMVQPVF
ncbi:MAG: acyl--CoA ligase [Desulfatibacillum sp.]|nr:acyl--CoA ligase [Desulfatibacillum sp.]